MESFSISRASIREVLEGALTHVEAGCPGFREAYGESLLNTRFALRLTFGVDTINQGTVSCPLLEAYPDAPGTTAFRNFAFKFDGLIRALLRTEEPFGILELED